MYKKLVLAAVVCFTNSVHGQTSDREILASLSNVYVDYYQPVKRTPKKLLLKMQATMPISFKSTAAFVSEAVVKDNQLLTPAFLRLPDLATLKNIYIITATAEIVKVNRLGKEKIPGLVDSLVATNPPRNDLVLFYYTVLFGRQSFRQLSAGTLDKNIDIGNYNLENETEEGIFFLEWIIHLERKLCNYIFDQKVPDSKEVYKMISHFPRFDGEEYFKYTRFDFPDYKIQGTADFKEIYISRFHDVLLLHLHCLKKIGASEAEIKDLVSNSILQNGIYYKYYHNTVVLQGALKLLK